MIEKLNELQGLFGLSGVVVSILFGIVGLATIGFIVKNITKIKQVSKNNSKGNQLAGRDIYNIKNSNEQQEEDQTNS